MAVHLTVASDGFNGVFLWCHFSHEMSWMRSGTLLSQFLRVFLPTSCTEYVTGKKYYPTAILLPNKQLLENCVSGIKMKTTSVKVTVTKLSLPRHRLKNGETQCSEQISH